MALPRIIHDGTARDAFRDAVLAQVGKSDVPRDAVDLSVEPLYHLAIAADDLRALLGRPDLQDDPEVVDLLRRALYRVDAAKGSLRPLASALDAARRAVFTTLSATWPDADRFVPKRTPLVEPERLLIALIKAFGWASDADLRRVERRRG